MFRGRKVIPVVTDLVSEFTGKFQEVVEANERIADTQAALIAMAEETKATAESEKQLAQNFIDNFEKLLIQ